jgi:hypothetical protein
MPSPQGGGFAGMGGTGPALDLQTIIQAVTKNNPGAPPGVIARAVNSAIPLMNAQAQMEWKQAKLDLQAQLGFGGLGIRQQGVDIRQEGVEVQQARALEQANNMRRAYQMPEFKSWEDMQRQLRGEAPAAAAAPEAPGAPGGAPGAPGTPAPVGGPAAIAQAVKDGRHSPILTGLGKMRGPTEGILAQDKTFNLAEKQLEWRQAERMVNAITSPQVVKWQQSALAAQSGIKRIRELSKELDMNSIRMINKASLEKKIQVDQSTPAGKTAQKYIDQVQFLRSDLATLEQGGYAPTQDAWEVAKQQIDISMAVGSMDAALDTIEEIVGYRLTALKTVSGGRFGTPNPYLTPPGGTPGTPGTSGAPGPAPPPTTPGQIQLGPGVKMTPPKPAQQPFEPFAD